MYYLFLNYFSLEEQKNENSFQQCFSQVTEGLQRIFKVYNSQLENLQFTEQKLKRIDSQNSDLEQNYQQIIKKQQQEREIQNKIVQYVDYFDKKQMKFQIKQQVIILHCAEIDRLIDLQSKLRNMIQMVSDSSESIYNDDGRKQEIFKTDV
ncbi:unnamed protein product [Paramecium octaurelia]|uniref:Uncharacterized protein n=1 Tax=Paramecium octaurelia TaxID=43137 RepID=A0A8S1USG2_PAROT|nr:unnamed protein product [Paramecium octaurelia]